MERAKTLAGSDHTSVYCETHLSNLIRLSMADSKLTRYEFNTIKHVASFLGIKDDVFKEGHQASTQRSELKQLFVPVIVRLSTQHQASFGNAIAQ